MATAIRFQRQASTRRRLQVDAGPDGTIGVVQDLGGHRAEDEAAERAIAVGGHDDEASFNLMRQGHDFFSGVALLDDAVGRAGREFLRQEVVQVRPNLLAAACDQFLQHGAADFHRTEFVVRRRQDVDQGDPACKCPLQRFRVAGWPFASL